jgi:hypothetical protein
MKKISWSFLALMMIFSLVAQADDNLSDVEALSVRESFLSEAMKIRRDRQRLVQLRGQDSGRMYVDHPLSFTLRFRPESLDPIVIRRVLLRVDESPWSELYVNAAENTWDHILVQNVEEGQRNMVLKVEAELSTAFEPFRGASRRFEAEALLPIYIDQRKPLIEIKVFLDVQGWLSNVLRMRLFEIKEKLTL